MNFKRSIRKMDTKKKWLIIIRVFAALVLWFGIYKGLAYLADTYLSDRIPEILQMLIRATLIPYGLAMPAAYLIIRGMKKAESDTPFMRPGFANLGKIFLIQSGLSFIALFPLSVLLKLMHINTPATTAEEILAHPLYYCFLLLIFAPLMEELLFRKIFFDRLMVLGTKTAILISAVFFALPHLVSQGPAQVFYTFVLALSFGYVTARTRKLWPAILLHSLSNLYCGIIAAVWPKDKPLFMLAYFAVYLIAMPAAAVLLAVFNRKKLCLD